MNTNPKGWRKQRLRPGVNRASWTHDFRREGSVRGMEAEALKGWKGDVGHSGLRRVHRQTEATGSAASTSASAADCRADRGGGDGNAIAAMTWCIPVGLAMWFGILKLMSLAFEAMR